MLLPSLLSLPQPARHITDGPSASLHMTSNCVLFPLPSSLSDLKECYRFFADCFCNVPCLKQIKSGRTNKFPLYTKQRSLWNPLLKCLPLLFICFSRINVRIILFCFFYASSSAIRKLLFKKKHNK